MQVSLKDIKGNLRKKYVQKYKIKWDGKSRSKFQRRVKQFLKPYWFSSIVFEEFPVYGTRLKVDIINLTKKIAVEAQGRQHEEFVKHFHGTKANLLNSMRRDGEKREWLEYNGFQLVEIYEKDILSIEFFESQFGIKLL